MISGKYIGEVARIAMNALVKEKVLFGGKSSEKFETHQKFDTKFVSQIEAG